MIERFVAGWTEFIIKRRIFVIVTSFLCLGLFLVPMKNLYFDNSNEMWFIPGDPALVKYDQLRDLFGSSQYLVIGLQARDQEKTVFSKENLVLIAKIHEFLENHEYVEKVSSLFNYQYIHAENDVLTTSDLIEDIETLDESEDEMNRLIGIMNQETLVHDYLVSKDMVHTVIMAKTVYIPAKIDHQVALIDDLNAFLEPLHLDDKGYVIRFAGNPVISENFLKTSIKDSSTTLPVMFFLTIVFLWFAFRRLSGVTMPLIVIIGSVFSIFGFIGLFGWALNQLNIYLPVMLIAIGIGDSVHIIVEYYHGIDDKLSPLEAAKESLRQLFIPCLNTSLTTALGFIAVSTTQLKPLREFGTIAAIGVFMAFLISVSTLPAILSLLKPRKSIKKKSIHQGVIANITNGLTDFTQSNRLVILVVSSILIIISVWYTATINVDTNFVNNFKTKSKMRQDMLYFDETYHGGYNIEFILDSGERGGIKNPEFLKESMQFQEYLESLPETGRANSMLNYLRKMNKVMNNDDETYYVIPDTRALIAQLLFLYTTSSPEEDLTDLISFDERFIRISLRVKNMPTSEMQVLVDEIEKERKKSFPGLQVDEAGDTILWNNMSVYIQEGIIRSFSIAFFTILMCFFVLFRSVKYGLLSAIPSLTPILAAGGLMGFMEIDLDFSTMMVAAITFGIAVDDTIHVMNRYIVTRKSGKTRKQSIHKAVTESGRAIIFTSFILYFGFSVMMLSSFVPNIYFGFFSGVILIIALVTNLVLLPAIVLVNGDKK